MRNKTKSQNTFPPPLPSSWAHLHSQILYQTPSVAQGDRECGLWSVHHTLFSAASSSSGAGLITLFPAPAWGPSLRRQSSTNFSNVGPSHRLQFFTNCSSMGPFHSVQSFRNTLLQCGSPVGSQVLPENLLRGLLSPQICRSCQEPAPAQGSHGCHSLLWEPTCSGVGSSLGCRWRSAPLWTSLGCRGTACLTMVFPTGCRGISSLAPGGPPPPPSSLTLVFAVLFHTHFSHSSPSLLLHSIF